MKLLRSKRLCIIPMTNEELQAQVNLLTEGHLRQAYIEMLNGSMENPADRLWYTAWRITLKGTGETIGSLGFKGKQKNGEVEIGYGINPPYQNQGFGAEAVKAVTDWAFSDGEVYFITAQTEPENIASRRVLEKLNFRPAGEGNEGLLFELVRPKPYWMSIYMCLGMSTGLCFGLAQKNMAIGMCIGLAIGTALGISLDASDDKKRKSLQDARSKSKEITTSSPESPHETQQ